MKTASKIVVAVILTTMVWAGTGFAQSTPHRPEGSWCGPEGTWFGQNETYGLEFVVTIESLGRGCFSVVSEGVENVPPWEYSTAWRGLIRKTGQHTFSWEQITYAGPSQLTDPAEGVPDIAGIRGVMTMLGCNHFEIDFEPTEVYAWGQTPFEDEPEVTMPPSIANYTRVPIQCGPRNE